MTWYIETIKGKSYWKMSFTAEEWELLSKHHKVISRLTKIDFSNIFQG